MKYDTEWKGLDQGVEFTWQPEIIHALVSEIAKHGTFDFGDEGHAIWDKLESLHPEYIWRNTGGDTFRPIFRRSNTLKQLGLVNLSGREMTLTSLATDYLLGKVTLNEIIIKACTSHKEAGERPFAIVARAFLELPNERFSVEDVELGIGKGYRPDVDDITSSLKDARNSNQNVSGTRRRRIRAIMDRFSQIGAISGDAQNGWKAADEGTLLEILDAAEDADLAEGISITPIIADRQELLISEPGSGVAKINFRPFTPGGGTTEYLSRLTTATDPAKKIALLEKASRRHQFALEKLAFWAESIGMTVTEDPDSYDLYACRETLGLLFEVKSWTSNNLKEQIRKAVAQLYEYRYRAGSAFKEGTQLIIVLDRNPIAVIEPWTMEYLREDRGIDLMWIENEAPVSSSGKFSVN